MRFIAIGRSEWLFNSIQGLIDAGHTLKAIVSDVGAPEYNIQLNVFSDYASTNSIPFLASSNETEIADFLQSIGTFDIGVSANHSRILTNIVLDLFPLGILNFHGGDLPRYRGNACQAWAIINGEKQVAACIHRMIPDVVDIGPIVSRSVYQISDSTKIGEIYRWMDQVAPTMFIKSLASLELDPDFELKSQILYLRAHRCYSRRPEDGKIIWSLSPINIVRLINASGFPYSGAFCSFKGRTLRIFDAEVAILDEDISAINGQVIAVEPESIVVSCGENQAIRIFKVSLDDNTILSASKVLTSTRQRLY